MIEYILQLQNCHGESAIRVQESTTKHTCNASILFIVQNWGNIQYVISKMVERGKEVLKVH